MVKFRAVTRFSQIVAIVLGVLIFLLGIYVGMEVEKHDAQAQGTELIQLR